MEKKTAALQGQYKNFRPVQGPLRVGEGPSLLVSWRIPAWEEGTVSSQTVSLSPVPGKPGTWEADHYIGLTRAQGAHTSSHRDDDSGKLQVSSWAPVAATGEEYRIRYTPATEDVEVLVRTSAMLPVDSEWGTRAVLAASVAQRTSARDMALLLPLPLIPPVPTEGYVTMRGQSYSPGAISSYLEIVQGDGDTLILDYVEGWPIPSNHSREEERYRKVAAVWDGKWRMSPARDCWLGRYKPSVGKMVKEVLGL